MKKVKVRAGAGKKVPIGGGKVIDAEVVIEIPLTALVKRFIRDGSLIVANDEKESKKGDAIKKANVKPPATTPQQETGGKGR